MRKSPEEIAKIDADIVNTLLKTGAINFEALGQAIAQIGPASIALDDGWDRWCGNDLRIYRWPRVPFARIEELAAFRSVVRDLVRSEMQG